MNCLKTRRSFAKFLADVHRGLEQAGLDRDAFSFDDLRYLAASRHTADAIVAMAKDMAQADRVARELDAEGAAR